MESEQISCENDRDQGSFHLDAAVQQEQRQRKEKDALPAVTVELIAGSVHGGQVLLVGWSAQVGDREQQPEGQPGQHVGEPADPGVFRLAMQEVPEKEHGNDQIYRVDAHAGQAPISLEDDQGITCQQQ